MQMTLFDTDIDEQIHETLIKDLKRGSGFSGSKKRILNIFNKNLPKSEAIEMLKDEYGIGGLSVTGYSQRHDSKGIKITLDKINNGKLEIIGSKQYSWSQVYDAIFNLIESGEYFEALEGEEIE